MGSNKIPVTRNLVRSALPGTCAQIAIATGLPRKSVNNAMRILRKREDVYPIYGHGAPVWAATDGEEEAIRIEESGHIPNPSSLARRNSIYEFCSSPKTRKEIALTLGIPMNTVSYDLEWLIDSGQIERADCRIKAATYVRTGGVIPEAFRTVSGLWATWVGVNKSNDVPEGDKFSSDTRHPTPSENTGVTCSLGSSMETFIDRFG